MHQAQPPVNIPFFVLLTVYLHVLQKTPHTLSSWFIDDALLVGLAYERLEDLTQYTHHRRYLQSDATEATSRWPFVYKISITSRASEQNQERGVGQRYGGSALSGYPFVLLRLFSRLFIPRGTWLLAKYCQAIKSARSENTMLTANHYGTPTPQRLVCFS